MGLDFRRTILACIVLPSCLLSIGAAAPLIYQDSHMASRELMALTVIPSYNYMGSWDAACDCCTWLCDETEGYYYTNGTCVECDDGHYLDTAPTTCLACRDCHYVSSGVWYDFSSECGDTTNAVCAACAVQSVADCNTATHYFVDGTGMNSSSQTCPMCIARTTCASTQYDSNGGGTATTDRVCLARCSQSLSSQYTSADGDATTDDTCTACSVCGDATFTTQDTACTDTADTTCKACTARDCSSENFKYFVNCTSTVDTSCNDWTVCVDGTTYSQNNTADAMTNSVCLDCTVCAAGTVQKEACRTVQDSTNNKWYGYDTVCGACNDVMPSSCLATQYYRNCSGTNNNECVDLTPCTAGSTYESVAPSILTDRTCEDCSTCNTATEIIKHACNVSANTVCQACQDNSTLRCTWDQYYAGCNGINTDNSCMQCTRCSATQYQVSDCTATADRSCAACGTCPVGQYTSTVCTGPTGAAPTLCTACTNKPDAVIHQGPADKYLRTASSTGTMLTEYSAAWVYTTNSGDALTVGTATGCTWECAAGYYRMSDANGMYCVACLDGTSSQQGSTSAAQCTNSTRNGVNVRPVGFETCPNVPHGAKQVEVTGRGLQCNLFSGAATATGASCEECATATSCAANQYLDGSCSRTTKPSCQALPGNGSTPGLKVKLSFTSSLSMTAAAFNATAQDNYKASCAAAAGDGVSASDVNIDSTTERTTRRAGDRALLATVLDVGTSVTVQPSQQGAVTTGLQSNLASQVQSTMGVSATVGAVSASFIIATTTAPPQTTPAGGSATTPVPTISGASSLAPLQWLAAALLAVLSAAAARQ